MRNATKENDEEAGLGTSKEQHVSQGEDDSARGSQDGEF